MYTAAQIQQQWNAILRDMLNGRTMEGFALKYADAPDQVPGGALAVLNLGYTIAYLMGIR